MAYAGAIDAGNVQTLRRYKNRAAVGGVAKYPGRKQLHECRLCMLLRSQRAVI